MKEKLIKKLAKKYNKKEKLIKILVNKAIKMGIEEQEVEQLIKQFCMDEQNRTFIMYFYCIITKFVLK